jgi:hypothetical protein
MCFMPRMASIIAPQPTTMHAAARAIELTSMLGAYPYGRERTPQDSPPSADRFTVPSCSAA